MPQDKREQARTLIALPYRDAYLRLWDAYCSARKQHMDGDQAVLQEAYWDACNQLRTLYEAALDQLLAAIEITPQKITSAYEAKLRQIEKVYSRQFGSTGQEQEEPVETVERDWYHTDLSLTVSHIGVHFIVRRKKWVRSMRK